MDQTEILSPDERERRGVDRRTLIKRAAAAGAAVWTAPLILDSVASPAGAISCIGGCFRSVFVAHQFNCEISFNGQPVFHFCPLPTTGCATVTDVALVTSWSGACIIPPTGDCETTSPVTFGVSPNCTWQGGGTCDAPRSFVAAVGQLRPVTGGPIVCVPGSISANGASVTFTNALTTHVWFHFQFLMGCSCS